MPMQQPAMQMMQVTCPPGVAAGAVMMVATPSGQQMQVTVPAGVAEGTQFQIMVPSPSPAPTGSPDDALAIFHNTPGFEIKGMRASEHDMSNDWDLITQTFQSPPHCKTHSVLRRPCVARSP